MIHLQAAVLPPKDSYQKTRGGEEFDIFKLMGFT
jgi:hypothetical protein